MLHRVGHGLAITPAVVGRSPLQPLPGYVASVGLALLSAQTLATSTWLCCIVSALGFASEPHDFANGAEPLQPLPGYVASVRPWLGLNRNQWDKLENG